MPNRRVTISPEKMVGAIRNNSPAKTDLSFPQTSSRDINAYIYPTNSRKPFSVKVHTYLEELHGITYQSPIVEPFLRESRLQPYIHDCTVHISIAGRGWFTYRIFFKNHRRLTRNKSVFTCCRERLRGDLLVMLMDAAKHVYIPMRLGDIKRFNLVLKR